MSQAADSGGEDIEMQPLQQEPPPQPQPAEPQKTVKRNTMEFYNSRTRVKFLEDERKILFRFDYSGENEEEECITSKDLEELIANKKWGVVQHPMVLHFINEIMIQGALYHVNQIMFLLCYIEYMVIRSTSLVADMIGIIWMIPVEALMIYLIVKQLVSCKSSSGRIRLILILIIHLFVCLLTLAHFLIQRRILDLESRLNSGFKTLIGQPDFADIEWERILLLVCVFGALIIVFYISQKSPTGIYFFMCMRILKSFMKIAISICLPILLFFSVIFSLLLKDSDIEPWNTAYTSILNGTSKYVVLLKEFVKISTMMTGEIGVNDILAKESWPSAVLVLVFEIIAVVVLMNLMVSVAVGDVNDLRNESQDAMLKMQISFVMEVMEVRSLMHFWLRILLKLFCALLPSHRRPVRHISHTARVLVLDYDGDYYTILDELTMFDGTKLKAGDPLSSNAAPKTGIPELGVISETLVLKKTFWRGMKESLISMNWHACIREQLAAHREKDLTGTTVNVTVSPQKKKQIRYFLVRPSRVFPGRPLKALRKRTAALKESPSSLGSSAYFTPPSSSSSTLPQ